MAAHSILTNSHGDAVSYAAEHTVWRGPKARMRLIRSRASARSRSASSSPVTSLAADGRTTGSIPSAQLPRASTCACGRVAWDACPLAGPSAAGARSRLVTSHFRVAPGPPNAELNVPFRTVRGPRSLARAGTDPSSRSEQRRCRTSRRGPRHRPGRGRALP